MKKIEVYTIPGCPHCAATKELLNSKGVSFEEIDVSAGRDEMIKRTGGPNTVPQIFVDGDLIEGGNYGIQKLEEDGKLDEVLGL